MKRGTPDHPKMKKFARLIKMPVFAAVGIMEMLWHWTAKFAPAGDIGRFEDADIAEAVSWPSDRSSSELIDAMVESKWVDRTKDESRLYIHGWHEHADDTVHMSLARDTKFFANGVMPKLSRMSNDEKKRIEDAFKALESNGQAHNDASNAHKCASKRTAIAMPCLSQAIPIHSHEHSGRVDGGGISEAFKAVAGNAGINGRGVIDAGRAGDDPWRVLLHGADIDAGAPVKSRPAVLLARLKSGTPPKSKPTPEILYNAISAGVVKSVNGKEINGSKIGWGSSGLSIDGNIFVSADKLAESSIG